MTTEQQANPPPPNNGAIQKVDKPTAPATTELFAGTSDFGTAQRIATALASSSLVPKELHNSVPNVLIAMEVANRIGASVFSVMQSLDIIHGRPSWRAQFLIATVNASGRFTPLRFRWQGEQGSKDWGCRAVARDVSTDEECLGSLITMNTAHEEGWSTKSGSKWKTIPEQMLMYRAAAFWTRVYAPELSLGMQTSDEVSDTMNAQGQSDVELPRNLVPGSATALETALGLPPREPAQVIDAQGEAVTPSKEVPAPAETKTETVPVQTTLEATASQPRQRR
jgi:hypothetical protein